MLHYNRNEVFQFIDVNNTITSKECITCHCCSFLNIGFKFQPFVYNDCHHILMMSIDINITILNIDITDYRYIIFGISKSETIEIIKSSDLDKESW